MTLASVFGRALRGVFVAIMWWRHPRPIHSRGIVLHGTMTRWAAAVPSGIAWVDAADRGEVEVVARLSRSVGLPPSLPDVIGLAVRIPGETAPMDLELASTGLGIPSRFILTLRRSASRARFGTLFPYRTPRGAVLLCALPMDPDALPAGGRALDDALAREPWRLRMLFATPTGVWHPFGVLSLHRADRQDDADLRFDSVRHPLTGTDTYTWVRALRQPSYERVQGGEGGSPS